MEELVGDPGMCESYRAARVQIDAQDTSKPFHVVLDGELYGPFTRIRLYPCRLPGVRSELVTFPIATTWHMAAQAGTMQPAQT